VGKNLRIRGMKIKDIFPLADFTENADFNLKILMIVKKIR